MTDGGGGAAEGGLEAPERPPKLDPAALAAASRNANASFSFEVFLHTTSQILSLLRSEILHAPQHFVTLLVGIQSFHGPAADTILMALDVFRGLIGGAYSDQRLPMMGRRRWH